MCPACKEGYIDSQGYSAIPKDLGGYVVVSPSLQLCKKVYVFKVTLGTPFNEGKNHIPDGSSGGSATVGQLEIPTLTHQQYYNIFISEF